MRILVGKILSAFGVKGAVCVKSYTHNPFDLMSYPNVVDENDNVYIFSRYRIKKGAIITTFLNELTTRTQAEAVVGKKLFINRDALPTLQENEYYFEDLKDMSVMDHEEIIGKIVDVDDHGAGTYLTIEAHPKRLWTLPFHDQSVIDVDAVTKTVTIDKRYLLG